MNVSNADRAEILVQALPYIKKYTGKIVVIKYGGNAMINEDLKNSVMSDIILLTLVGVIYWSFLPSLCSLYKYVSISAGSIPEFVQNIALKAMLVLFSLFSLSIA